tara:strand:+ start:14190 stop:14780 length:591 start_codon:yes stop_codon:yes gene_type:complete
MPLTLPAAPGFATFAIRGESVVASAESGFSKQVQVYDWGGKRWTVTASLPVMSLDNAREWEAFFRRLNGRAGTFYLHDAPIMAGRGAARGAPIVATVSGKTLNLTGFLASTVSQVAVGDWLQIGDRLYQAETQADADVTGAASLDVWPEPPSAVTAGDVVILLEPKGEFRLLDTPEIVYRTDGLAAGFEFVAVSEV